MELLKMAKIVQISSCVRLYCAFFMMGEIARIGAVVL